MNRIDYKIKDKLALKWLDDKLQFARVLSEINATQQLNFDCLQEETGLKSVNYMKSLIEQKGILKRKKINFGN